jgi:tetratricopeptide (TPR) repeat protein
LFFLLPFLILFVCFQSVANSVADSRNNVQGAKDTAADPLRQDILRFVGPVSETLNFTMPDDAYLVRIIPKRGVNSDLTKPVLPYNMLIRNVDPAERSMLQDAQDGKWDNFNPFSAAMIAEGFRDPVKIRTYKAKVDAIIVKVYNELNLQVGQQLDSATAEKLTEKLFRLLHKEILTGKYDINCTNLSSVFETGKFNCVSATILFNVIAEQAGLKVRALEMPGHALSRVYFNDKYIDIETTCANWYELKDEAARATATIQRVAKPIISKNAVAANKISDSNLGLESEVVDAEAAAKLSDLSKKLREISAVNLIATIYYNNGVDLLNDKQYAAAVMVNVKALHLDPYNETAWGNFMIAINNWSIELSSGSTTGGIKRYDLAAIMLDQGSFIDSNYEKFKTNQLHVYYHWILDLAIKGRTEDAKKVFSYADKRLPGNPALAELMEAILKK